MLHAFELTALAALAIALALLVVGLALDLAGHAARYRRYRRSYPAADRGRVWSYTARR